MATKAEVLSYLTSTFPNIDVRGSEHGVVVVTVASDSGEDVSVIVDIFDGVLAFTRPFALCADIDANDALETLRGFGLVEFSGSYAARQVITMDGLALSNLGAYIDVVAHDALRS